jgi:hypothetical protein
MRRRKRSARVWRGEKERPWEREQKQSRGRVNCEKRHLFGFFLFEIGSKKKEGGESEEHILRCIHRFGLWLILWTIQFFSKPKITEYFYQ